MEGNKHRGVYFRLILKEKATDWQYAFKKGWVPLNSIWPSYSGKSHRTYLIDTDKLNNETKIRLAAILQIKFKVTYATACEVINTGCSIHEKYALEIEFDWAEPKNPDSAVRTMVIKL